MSALDLNELELNAPEKSTKVETTLSEEEKEKERVQEEEEEQLDVESKVVPKKQLYSHKSIRYKYGLATQFLELKRNDQDARLFLSGSYAWAPDKERLFEPAKVVEQVEYSPLLQDQKVKDNKLKKRKISNVNPRKLMKTANALGNDTPDPANETLGKVVVEHEGKVILRNVSAKAAKNLLPMQNDHLDPSNIFNLELDDLSTATLLHNLRFQFIEKNADCLQIEEKTLIYANRFLNQEQLLERQMQNMLAAMGEGGADEPVVTVETFATKVFRSLNEYQGMQPQSCVISGNQQSNKRQMAQDFSRKVIQLSNPNDPSWFEKLQAADEVLTVFGGDSFLRWTELHLNYENVTFQTGTANQEPEKGKLIGAAFQSFLLDTSNVTNKGALSFDIFYQLCNAALKPEEEPSSDTSKDKKTKKSKYNFKTDLKKGFGLQGTNA